MSKKMETFGEVVERSFSSEKWWKDGCIECERLNKEWVENGKIGTVVPHQHVMGVSDIANVPEMIGPETFSQFRYFYVEESTGARKYYRVPAHLVSEVELGGMPQVIPEAAVGITQSLSGPIAIGITKKYPNEMTPEQRDTIEAAVDILTCTQPAKRAYSETTDSESTDSDETDDVRFEWSGGVRMEVAGRCKVAKL